ncbi:uncharacterized protein BXZ73DRAFT_74126 [Epithele typhae]|uniref:uncharacterized protein n=1 Tax=Epithele typhae TaxID=378194 RepID=UPI002008B60F|nr:uncharacterized protein BXZ73DRAFT_74126 [Epithele typhae]KAH9943082.1 hypothetical protein BXZ73DRAFT_74126 [Epithele typhae]
MALALLRRASTPRSPLAHLRRPRGALPACPLSTGTQTSPGAGARPPPPPSPHARFYSEYAAGMVPVALLGSVVYIGLRTWQQHLAHERFLVEAEAHVRELEAEVVALRHERDVVEARAASGGRGVMEGDRQAGRRWWHW